MPDQFHFMPDEIHFMPEPTVVDGAGRMRLLNIAE